MTGRNGTGWWKKSKLSMVSSSSDGVCGVVTEQGSMGRAGLGPGLLCCIGDGDQNRENETETGVNGNRGLDGGKERKGTQRNGKGKGSIKQRDC